MNEEKLEEIARLLGGISDKLDAFAREQQRMARIAARWDGDGSEPPPTPLKSKIFGGNGPVIDPEELRAVQAEIVRRAEDAREAAQHAAALAHRDKFGGPL